MSRYDAHLPEVNFSSKGIRYIYPYVDSNGQPIERTPSTHPYNYDSYVLWRNLPNDKVCDGAYSDRMRQWDSEKFERCWKEHCGTGQYWSEYSQEQITNFVRAYYDNQEIQICYLQQCCNQATGFPLWYVAFYKPKAENGS